MSLFSFLKSKVFLRQLAIAFIAIVIISFLMLRWLNYTTNHGDFRTVPNLKGKSLEVAEMELEENDLVLQVQDSANFNPKYPRFSVIDQEPVAETQVKENRKIYVTLNPSGYRKIAVPNLRERTFRQAKPMLEALGFQVGKTIYIDNIGKDVVLGMEYNGKPIKSGELLSKTATIDLVLGNGNTPNSIPDLDNL